MTSVSRPSPPIEGLADFPAILASPGEARQPDSRPADPLTLWYEHESFLSSASRVADPEDDLTYLAPWVEAAKKSSSYEFVQLFLQKDFETSQRLILSNNTTQNATSSEQLKRESGEPSETRRSDEVDLIDTIFAAIERDSLVSALTPYNLKNQS